MYGHAHVRHLLDSYRPPGADARACGSRFATVAQFAARLNGTVDAAITLGEWPVDCERLASLVPLRHTEAAAAACRARVVRGRCSWWGGCPRG